MSRQYDTKTTIFSPEGRLYQVEYAMEAINHAGNCLGLLASDGILLAAEYRLVTPLLDEAGFSEKIYRLDKHVACSVAGITGDANVLTEYLRTTAQRHVIKYGDPMPVEQLVQSLSDVKQRYTQFGGLRPFGVSILYMGWDKHYKYQLYQSDPSGNYSGWKATCIGKNQQQAMSQLRQDYKEGQLPTLQEAKALAIKVFSKTIDAAKLSVDTVEIATLQRTEAVGEEQKALVLYTYTVPDSTIWYIRFSMDMNLNILVAGNQVGSVFLYSLRVAKKPRAERLSHPACNSTVRQVCFSPDTKVLIVACDDSTIWRWDKT